MATIVTGPLMTAQKRNMKLHGEPVWRYRWHCEICTEVGSVWFSEPTIAIVAGKRVHQSTAHADVVSDSYYRREVDPTDT